MRHRFRLKILVGEFLTAVAFSTFSPSAFAVKTPLHEVLDLGKHPSLLEVQRVVRSHTNWVDEEDECGNTPLFYAVRCGNLEIVKHLVQCGADVNHRDKWGHRPLNIAFSCHQLDILKYLIDRGADVNSKSGIDGGTVLHSAARNGNFEVVEYLVDHGANVNIKDNDGWRPLRKAYKFPNRPGNSKVISYLISKGAVR